MFRAIDLEWGETVALKLLHALGPHGVFALKQEFRALEGVRHPNLVRLFELHVDLDRAWFTMELVDGVSLEVYLQSAAAERTRALAAITQVLDGLEALHRAGRVHRDVKPANVVVSSAGRVVLLDPGLVIDAEGGEGSSFLPGAGTPMYMPPEQARGERVGCAADVYALGVMLSPYASWLPAGLQEGLRRAMSPDPQERPSVSELKATLPGCQPAPMPPRGFWGRARELATLDSCFGSWDRGTPRVVTVVGPLGVGKSRLVREWTRVGLPAEAVCVVGRCDPAESVPFQAVDRLLDRLARHLGGGDAPALDEPSRAALAVSFPVVAHALGVDAASAVRAARGRDRAFAALRLLLRAYACTRPVVVVLDDVQWLDDDSRALLEELVRPPDPVPLYLVCTHREGEWSSFRGQRCSELALAPLASADARLVALQCGARPDELDCLVEEAAGLPLYLTSLPMWGVSRIASWLETATIAVGPGAIDVLRLLALADAPLGLSGVAAVVPGAVSASRRLRELGMVGEVPVSGRAGTTLGLAHTSERLSRAVLATIPDAERAGWHRLVAECLERTGDPRDDLRARQLHGAGDTEAAVRLALVAADAAYEGQALGQAFRLYGLVREWDPSGHGAGVVERFAEVAGHLGKADVAARAWREAWSAVRDTARPETEGLPILTRLLEQLSRIGDVEGARWALGELLRVVGEPLPSRRLGLFARVLWRRLLLRAQGLRWHAAEAPSPDAALEALWNATLSRAFYDLLEQEYLGLVFLRLALRGSRPGILARAFAWEAAARERAPFRLFGSGDRLLEAARRLVSQGGAPYERGLVENYEVVLAFSRGDNAACLRAAQRALAFYAQDPGSTFWGEMNVHAFASGARWYAGHVRELREFVHGVRLDGRSSEHGGLLDMGHYWTAVRVAILEGRVDAAVTLLDACDARWARVGDPLGGWSRGLARAEIALARRDPQGAHAAITKAGPAVLRSGAWLVAWVAGTWRFQRSGVWLSAVQAGARPALLRGVRSDAAWLRRSGWSLGVATSALLNAGVALLEGRGSLVEVHLRAARDEADRRDAGLLSWWARRALARLAGEGLPPSLDPEVDADTLAWAILPILIRAEASP